MVYASELEGIAAEARSLESSGDLRKARESWLSCLPLLPQQSKQVAWILDRAKALDHAAEGVEELGQVGEQVEADDFLEDVEGDRDANPRPL